MQSDPIGLEAGINTYGYVDSNPIILIDLFGLSSCGPDCSARCEESYANCSKNVISRNLACEKKSFSACVKVGGSTIACKRAAEIGCAISLIPAATACELVKIACNLSCSSNICICGF